MSEGNESRRQYGAPDQESQLVTLWRVVRERWRVVVATAVLCVAATLIVSLTSDKAYDATSRLVFRDSGLGSAVTGGTPVFPTSTDPQREAATNTELVRSVEVAQMVVDDLSLNRSAEDLLDSMTISDEENTDIVDIQATESDPELAAAVANSFADSYVDFSRKSDREKVKQAERLLSERIRDTPEGSQERSDLEDAMRTLVLLESVQTGNAEVIDAATVPTEASSPTPVRDAIFALIFGLVLGIGLAVLLDLLDRRVKTVAGFEQRYGLRALAAIPQRLFGEIQNDGSVAEPFLILRSAVDYRSSWDAITVILVTSAGSGEGKTTVAVNLARSLALGGQQVALVEADLRRPGFERFIDLGQVGPGLSTALAMDTPVASDLITDPVAPTLTVLPAGPRPPNPAELVRRRRMGEVIDYLSSSNDVVIIDSPPLLPVADTQSLLNLVQIDTVLVVARAFRTTRQEITQARAILKRHEAEPLGLVVCGVRERLDYYQGYQPPPPGARSGSEGPTKPQGPHPAPSWAAGKDRQQ
jgi:capsular exopolysaccharide synthesis family protein